MENVPIDLQLYLMMKELLHQLKMAKPTDRNELARRYAVTITEQEKVLAYFNTFVINGIDEVDQSALVG